MRKLLALLAATVIAATGVQRSDAAVSVDFFYTSLEPHGGWIETSDYGYVWQPSEVAEDWRPYTVGSWAYTDAGWTWVSEEPHGWVTHHYGRWILVESAGWVWVPDTEWAPAWVSWRRSTTHVGWAPLPPEARFERTVGIRTWSDSYYDIGPTNYTFVEVRNIGAPRLATVVLPPQENITIIRETQNITNIVVQNNIIINEGPKYDVIVRESAQPIRRLRLERQTDIVVDGGPRDNWRGRVEGDVFRVAAPEVQVTADVRPPRVQRRIEKATVNRGWKGLEQRAEAKELRAEMRKEAPQPAGLPPEPKFERIAERAKRQRGPQDSTEIPEDVKKQAGEQAVVGTEGEMKERDRAKRRDAKTETADDAAPANAATNPDAAAPGDRANRRDRMKRDGQPATETDSASPDATKPGATTPEATTPDASTPDRQNRRMRERERAGAKAKTDAATDAQDEAKTATEEATSPADAKKQRNAADKAKMEADDAAKATTEGADSAQSEAKSRREAADAAKSEAKARREAADASKTEAETNGADEQKKRRGAAEARARQEAQSSEKAASEAASPATRADSPATSPDRRSPAERAERSPGAAAPAANEQRERANRPGAERPERAERPDRPERPQGAQGADRPNRPDRPQGGQGAPGAERGNRGNGGGGGGAAAEAAREQQKERGGNGNERRGGAPE